MHHEKEDFRLGPWSRRKHRDYGYFKRPYIYPYTYPINLYDTTAPVEKEIITKVVEKENKTFLYISIGLGLLILFMFIIMIFMSKRK